ncbi:hypothetical protein [Chryseobacterium sp.]|uniref:hypothetical protein n=1 Tax=Chryseobacterium sp. TaxID=1871047 RepID=UPI0011CC0E32|nr:hypothetical protein [Chryseobacterium sp.]TXF79607.1 hypothetical protein FUA25_04280 [Chryseobacterium sp.]
MKYNIIILTAFLLLNCSFNSTRKNKEEDKIDAENITKQFYSILNKSDTRELYQLFGEKFFNITSKKQLEKMLYDISTECGSKVTNTKLKKWETFVSNGTDSRSEYVLLYIVQRNIKNTEEKITLEKENGNIKIVGYDVTLAK